MSERVPVAKGQLRRRPYTGVVVSIDTDPDASGRVEYTERLPMPVHGSCLAADFEDHPLVEEDGNLLGLPNFARPPRADLVERDRRINAAALKMWDAAMLMRKEIDVPASAEEARLYDAARAAIIGAQRVIDAMDGQRPPLRVMESDAEKVDHRALLVKYMRHVRHVAPALATFPDDADNHTAIAFTDAEWDELKRLALEMRP